MASDTTPDAPIVAIEHRGRVAVMTMQFRPYNLLGPELIDALTRAFRDTDWSGTGAVVLRSAQRHFSAGADLAMFDQAIADGSAQGMPPMLPFIDLIERFPLPIVAAVHGVCLGGGFELALLCDYIVAAQSAKIGAVEATLGLHPLMGGIQRLVERCGVQRAKEMAMLARRHDPATLERWNVINLVVPDDKLDTTAFVLASEMAHGATLAHVATKQLVQVAVNDGIAAADRAMADIQQPFWTSQDLKIGLAAFRDGGPGSARFVGA